MKSRRLFLSVFVVLSGLVATVSAQTDVQNVERDADAPIRILAVGNSFTNNARQFLPDFVQAGGKKMIIFPVTIGGSSFERHMRHVNAFEADPESEEGRPYRNVRNPQTGERKDHSLREALEGGPWDYVTIQQLSNHSFKPETYEQAHPLIAYIRQYAPEAEIVIHQTWAYREDYAGFSDGGFSVEAMHEGLSAAYKGLADQYGFRIIPVGDAFFAARQDPLWQYQKDPDFDFENPAATDTLPDQAGSLHTGYRWRGEGDERRLTLDFKHANNAGKYLAAAVWYEFFFGEPAPETAPPASLSEEQAASLRRVAHETMRTSTLVTPEKRANQ